MSKMQVGKCRVCGRIRELSREHVPPQAAFNKGLRRLYVGEQVLRNNSLPWKLDELKPTTYQNGIKFPTLCVQCNGDTANWYVKQFAYFITEARNSAIIAAEKKLLSPGASVPLCFREIHPLEVLKEVVTMFASVNHPDFFDRNSRLRDFVLNPLLMGLPAESYRIGAYIAEGKISKYNGVQSIFHLSTGSARTVSELTAPPLGFVLELNPDYSTHFPYWDITFFASSFHPGQAANISINVPVIENNTPFPLDHRSRLDVSLQAMRNSSSPFDSRGFGPPRNL